MVKVFIVDDEKLSRDSIRILLRQHHDIKIVGEAGNGKAAVSGIKAKRPDLVFLDVQMPGMDGLEVVRQVGPENMPVTVFVTAHDQYALKAFEAQAIDYLLKPFTDQRFEKALKRAKQSVLNENFIASVMKLTVVVDGQKKNTETRKKQFVVRHQYLSRVPVKIGRKLILLRTEQIDWIEAADYYVQLHVGPKKFLLRESINNLEKKLDPVSFVRVHRAALVQINKISEISKDESEQAVVLYNGTHILVSRRRIAAVRSSVLREA